MESSVLETIIYGRVEPHIYAFQTDTVPRYTKVGDTYRPTEVRLKEWKNIIGKELTKIFDEPAFADLKGEVYFRDYSVHSYLIEYLGKRRLCKTDPEGNPWFSNEFFSDTDSGDLAAAIKDIQSAYANGNARYDFYNTVDKSHSEVIERLNLTYKPRRNQQDVIDRFDKRVKSKGKLNLLMYAVMRFGKTFTALQCALVMDAKLVVVVSAKTDVKDSWHKTLYEHHDFNDYYFIDSKTLKDTSFNLKKNLDEGKKYVLFLSLQDLSGKDIKSKHKQLFTIREPKSLLIVDETHFGARAAEYGQVLRSSSDQDKITTEDLSDTITADKLDVIKNFDMIRVRIHLSGTPYRILMNGEFSDKDIISFVQYGDIVKAQKEWDREHFSQESEESEWDNPYFGFPEMVRFAFHPNRDSLELIDRMKKQGAGGLSELFSPTSVEESPNPIFKYPDQVLGLLKAIDGTQADDNIFPFLNFEKIKEGKMCRHMVWVLPFQSSCDAMERLLKAPDSRLSKLVPYSSQNVNGYEIINISGYHCPKKYDNPQKVTEAIKEFEQSDIKTITLTVQRMLTGSTVPEWDTMLFLKDTTSPQEYDQATFRIQNPYIQVIDNSQNGRKKGVIKINMKPQTLLVDFDPARMFRMQEARSEYYLGENGNGNNSLKERIKEDLEISPIIQISEDKLVRVEASSVIDAVREYSKSRSVLDEASLIPSDDVLLDDKNIRAVIGALEALNNKKGLEFNPFEGAGDSTALSSLKKLLKSLKNKNSTNGKSTKEEESEEEILRKKLKTLYASLLMFSFLSNSKIKYLEDIIDVLDKRVPDDIRIANNLGININILKLIRDKASQNVRHHLDNRIENIHDLMQKTEGNLLDKAQIALNKFDRLSASEIVTPLEIRDILVNGISEERVSNTTVFLDVASKQGELTLSLLNRFPTIDKRNCYSVATSTVAYEMTRKVYDALGIPVENILLPPKAGDKYYDRLLKTIQKGINKSPNIVLCCPPFQKPKGGGRGDGGSDIYPSYFDLCRKLNPNKPGNSTIPYLFGMYTKATWNTHSTKLSDDTDKSEEIPSSDKKIELKISEFRKMMLTDLHITVLNDYFNAKPFYNKGQSVTLRGGVTIFFWDAKEHENVTVSSFIDYNHLLVREKRKLLPDDLKNLMLKNGIVDTIIQDYPYVRIGGIGYSILTNVLKKSYDEHFSFLKVFPRNIFKITENIEKLYKGKPAADNGVKVYVQQGNWVTVDKKLVKGYDANGSLVDSWKVVAAKGSSGEDIFPHSIISQPRIVEPKAVCSDTYLVIKACSTKEEAESFVKYMKTGFFRFMMLLAKNDQNLTRHCYRFVPDIPNDKYDSINELFNLGEPETLFINSLIKEMEATPSIGKSLNC